MTLHRFSIGPLKFLRRPVSEAPPAGTICFVDSGDAHGFTDRTHAIFEAGAWTNGKGKALRFEPTHWITFDDGSAA